MDQLQDSNEVPVKKHSRLLLILAGIIIFLFLGLIVLGVYFYSLVKKNTNLLNNNQAASSVEVAAADDPFFGSQDAKVVIVEFSDFQCPYCGSVFPVVRELLNKYGQKIKFIFRDFPLTDTHPQAQKSAEAANCAFDQGKFWEMHDKIFINQNDLILSSLKRYAAEIGLDQQKFNQCLDSGRYAEEIQKDISDGLAAGVDGTPTFFINNHKFEGTPTIDEFSTAIDQLLAIYGQK